MVLRHTNNNSGAENCIESKSLIHLHLSAYISFLQSLLAS